MVWVDFSRALAREARKLGLIETDEVESLDAAEVEKLQKMGSYFWGASCAATASRARRDLGWEPMQKGIFDRLGEELTTEKELMDRRMGGPLMF